MQQSAGAIIVTHDNRILLQRRDNKPGLVNAGKLAVFGGYLEGDEDAKAALTRELKEELGADVEPAELEQISDQTYTLPDAAHIRIRHFLWFEKTPRITGVYEGEAAYYASLTELFSSGDPIIQSARNALDRAREKLSEQLR